MAKIKNYVSNQNLAQYSVYIKDINPTSTYFILGQLQDVLTGGKNAFLINGSEFLKKTTEVLVEIIDSEGNTVYIKPVRNYVEGISRVVSIEIYEDTPRGPATMTILGEATHDEHGIPVPSEWQGKYNVKYTKRFFIEPTKTNTTYIRLYNTPEMSAREVVLPYKEYGNVAGFMYSDASGSELTGNADSSTRTTSFFGWTSTTSTTKEFHTVRVTSGSQRFKREMIGGSYTASVEISGSFTVISSSATTLAQDLFTDANSTPLTSHSPSFGWATWNVDPTAVTYYRISNNMASSSGIPPFSFLPNVLTPAITKDNFIVYADIKAPSGNSHETGIILRANNRVATFDELNAFSSSFWAVTISPDHIGNLDYIIVFLRQTGSAGTSNSLFSGSIQNITGSGVRLVCQVEGTLLTAHIQPRGGGSVLYGPWSMSMNDAPNSGSSSNDTTNGHFGIYADGQQNAQWDNLTVTSMATTTIVPEKRVFSASIIDVRDSTTMDVNPPFKYQTFVTREIFGGFTTSTKDATLLNYTTDEYVINYLSSSAGLITLASRSMAEISLRNLTTFSGDVARAVFFAREFQGLGEYKQIGDVLLEENELTITQSANTGEANIQTGYFRDQTFADTYWFAGEIHSGSYSGSN